MSVDEYRKWRQVAISLHDKIRDVYVSGPVVDKAAKQLGVLVDKKTLIFDTDRQIDAFMECCLYLVKHKGMTPIERYANEVTPENSLEQALLQSFQQSKAGFYVIDSIDRHMCGLTLSGLFGAPGVTITDINFSKSVPPGFILHTRPLVLPGLAMASGCTFVFTPDKASLIQRLWNSNWKNLSPLYQFTNIFNFNNGSGVPVVTA